ncbi:unnamed protein product, partial [Iphiclides podalirius]
MKNHNGQRLGGRQRHTVPPSGVQAKVEDRPPGLTAVRVAQVAESVYGPVALSRFSSRWDVDRCYLSNVSRQPGALRRNMLLVCRCVGCGGANKAPIRSRGPHKKPYVERTEHGEISVTTTGQPLSGVASYFTADTSLISMGTLNFTWPAASLSQPSHGPVAQTTDIRTLPSDTG